LLYALLHKGAITYSEVVRPVNMNCNDLPFLRVRLVTKSLAIVFRWKPLNISPENSFKYSARRAVVLLIALLFAPGAVNAAASAAF